MSDLKKQLVSLLHETAHIWRYEIDRRLKRYGLSQAKWRALLHLDLTENPLTQTQLALRLGIEGATLVKLLDSLTQDGWLLRKDDAEDRRIKTVHLTAKAQRTLHHIHSAADQAREVFLSDVSLKDLKTCIKVLEMIKNKVEVPE